MLTLFRVHGPGCSAQKEKYDRSYRRCSCPINVEGMCGGEMIRRAMRTNVWAEAQRRITEAEARDSWEPKKIPEITIAQAKELFLMDVRDGRRLSAKTFDRYELMLRRLEEWAEHRAITYLHECDTAFLREFRENWKTSRLIDIKRGPKPLSPITATKRLELMKAFFRFCHESGWIEMNPTKVIKAPKGRETPKQPFNQDEMQRITTAAMRVNMAMGVQGDWGITNEALLTFIYLLRYSGLRIGDAVMLTPERVTNGRLLLSTQKTGQGVYVPLPPFLIERLKEVRIRHGKYYFVGPRSLDVDVIADVWRRKLNRVFKLALVIGTPHRFRHTFAVELLIAGVPIESVAVLLGHANIKITQKHYSAWVKSRQIALEEQVSRTWATA